jgi:hypothetical protein
MHFIENRPISCQYCGYNPVFGTESTYKNGKKTIHECRWICPRCNNLARLDEKIDYQDNEA